MAGSALVEHPGVAKIVFTGSTRTGKHIMARCAERVKRVTLELGGKSPNIVFADADVEAAAAAAPMSFLDNAGQDCCARTRILVERSVYDRFLDLLVPALSAVVVGDPADEKTQMGPLISAVQRERVRALVDGGREADGVRAILGTAPGGPRVLVPADRPHRGRARRAGGRGGGLRAGRGGPAVRGRGGRAASRRRHRLRALRLRLDPGRGPRAAREPGAAGRQPLRQLALQRALFDAFGGYKQSGLGRELGPDALAAFTETKNVFISTEA